MTPLDWADWKTHKVAHGDRYTYVLNRIKHGWRLTVRDRVEIDGRRWGTGDVVEEATVASLTAARQTAARVDAGASLMDALTEGA